MIGSGIRAALAVAMLLCINCGSDSNPLGPGGIIIVTPQIDLVQIPGGSFLMGSHDSTYSNEQPVHQVTISPFQMSKYEITNEQYAAYLNAALSAGEITVVNNSALGATGEYIGQEYISLSGSYDSDNKCWISFNGTSFKVAEGKDSWPVVYVTWYGAKAFALKYGFDLPREAEWEYAARGGQQFVFGTDDGTIENTKANFSNNTGHPREVGSYPENPFGLNDLAGNVQEWCNDRFSNYSSSNQTDPVGDTSGLFRIIRGGCWGYSEVFCRSSYRSANSREYKDSLTGFRVVKR